MVDTVISRVVNGCTISKQPKRIKGEVEELQGQTFGELKVIDFDSKDKNGRALWKCQCSCGKTCIKPARHLKSGSVISCGHIGRKNAAERIRKRSTTHGASNEPWYSNYASMCYRITHPEKYHNKYYSSQNIEVKLIEQEWLRDPWAFYNEIGPKPNSESSIDRINSHLGYIKGNVRWADRHTQSANRFRGQDDSSVKYQGISLARAGTNRRKNDRFVVTLTDNGITYHYGNYLLLDNAMRARYDAETKFGYPHTFNRPEGDLVTE